MGQACRLRIADEPSRQQRQVNAQYPRNLPNIQARFGKERCFELRKDGTMVFKKQKYNSKWQEYDCISARPGRYVITEYLMNDNTIKSFVNIRYDDGGTQQLRIYEGVDGYMHMSNGVGNYPKGEPLY